MADLIVRPFQKDDRQAVFRIGGDTAFFGEPIEAYMEDRNAFLDAFYAYYTDIEPEHSWVACADNEVVGFLTGCIDTRVYNRKIRDVIVPRVIRNVLGGKYHFGKLSLKYLSGMAGGWLRREFTYVDIKIYPAHLHINVDSKWRGYKLGRRLMEAYLEQLNKLGIPGVHLDTTSLNEIACRMYEKMGFMLLDSQPDRFWEKWFGHPVDNRCYGLKLLT